MPKSLVLGNGNILIGLDKFAQVNELYYPHVGLENQMGGFDLHRVGVYVDGQFSWLNDGSWEIKIDYLSQTLVGDISATNHNLNIRLEFNDFVYNETDIFLRQVKIYNLDEKERFFKIFFNQQFQIYESFRGDTGYFDPIKHVLVHYKGRRVFLINLVSQYSAFDDFSIGNFNSSGKEGTFKDAEDGLLSKNPIEHGLVDSVIAISFKLNPLESDSCYYWIACGRSIDDAQRLNEYVLDKTPQHLLRTTGDFWKAWVNKQQFNFYDLDSKITDLFKKSLFIIRTHVDNQGAIIASGDSDMLQHGKDNYSYMWPRDASLVALALDKVGDNEIARRFFEVCNEVITEGGYFMHKYRADKSLGSSWHAWIHNGQPQLPIQEDEIALAIIALKQHFDIDKDLEFIESIYNSFIKKAIDFMISYRDEKTHLPKPTYDLWEEKLGIHTFTVAAVYGALIAASDFASLLGKVDACKLYKEVASEIKSALMKYLYDGERGYFYKLVYFNGDDVMVDKTIDISSSYGVFKFGVLDIEDEDLAKSFSVTESALTVPGNVGGIVRYEQDYYYKVDPEGIGNPWFITTLWLAQYNIAKAKNKEELKKPYQRLLWVVDHALSSGVLSEQMNPFTGEHVSAGPLTWSHSEFVNTVLLYIEKLANLEKS